MPEPAHALRNDTMTVQITPLGGRTSMRLKSWLAEYASGGKAVALGGKELPSQVGEVLSDPAMRVLCIGPGEWLLASHEHSASVLRQYLEADLPKYGLALVDLTDGLLGLEVRGPASRELLSRGCGLDFHPRSFPAGRCARTRFANVPATIESFDEPLRFELYVVRSHLRYLHAWLSDAAVGLTPGPG